MNFERKLIEGDDRDKLIQWAHRPQADTFIRIIASRADYLEHEAIQLAQADLRGSIAKEQIPASATEKLSEAAMLRSLLLEFDRLREHVSSKEKAVEIYIPVP